jgi:hypothetical protein
MGYGLAFFQRILKRKNFDSLERKILTVWKGKFEQFGKENFDSLKRKI